MTPVSLATPGALVPRAARLHASSQLPGTPAPPSAAAGVIARRLWSEAAGTASSPMATVVVAELIVEHLRTGLARWIGSNGSRVLLMRAIRLVTEQHPALGRLPFLSAAGEFPVPAPVAPSARGVQAGMIALLAMVIELLGHLIGPEIAESLVQQAVGPSPRGVVSQRIPRGTRHG